jgi:hypothetical protein
VGIIAYGSTESAVEEARAQLAASGLKSSMMRVRALPFPASVEKFIRKYDQIIVVEMNRDGQMYQLFCMEFPELAPKLHSVAFQDGLPASAKWIREGILKFVKPAPKKPAKGSPARNKASSKKAVVKKNVARKGARK